MGEALIGGAVLGTVPETHLVEHRILLPPDLTGSLRWIAPQGEYTVTDPIARLSTAGGDEIEIPMLQRWPVRLPRPYQERLAANELLVTGQRVLDTFFPLAKGGYLRPFPAVSVPARPSPSIRLLNGATQTIIIYVGCGERGNEMTEVLQEFPQLEDPPDGAAAHGAHNPHRKIHPTCRLQPARPASIPV